MPRSSLLPGDIQRVLAAPLDDPDNVQIAATSTPPAVRVVTPPGRTFYAYRLVITMVSKFDKFEASKFGDQQALTDGLQLSVFGPNEKVVINLLPDKLRTNADFYNYGMTTSIIAEKTGILQSILNLGVGSRPLIILEGWSIGADVKDDLSEINSLILCIDGILLGEQDDLDGS